MKNRKLFAVILVVIMILTMIGCGKKSESALNDSVSEEQDVTDEVITPTEIETTTSDEFYGKFKDYSEYVELGKYSRMDIMVNPASDGDFQKQQMEYQRNVWDRVMDNCKILGYPEEQLDKFVEILEKYLKENGMEDEETLKVEALKLAKEDLGYIMIAMEIAKKEGITVTEETYNEYAKRYSDNIGFDSVETFKEIYGRDYIMGNIVLEFVCIWLYDNNTLVERIW